jgi:hypothetical protein
MAPQIDVAQLALYLPVETAAQAVADLRAQGLDAEADKLQAAVQAKMDDLANAKAEAERKAEADRQRALAEGRVKFDEAVADFVAIRDEALDYLSAYLDAAERAIQESAKYQSIYSAMHSLLNPEDYKAGPVAEAERELQEAQEAKGADMQTIKAAAAKVEKAKAQHGQQFVDPLPELPMSAMQIVASDPRFKGKFAASNHGLGGAVNL